MFLLEVFLPCRLQQLADTKRERRGRREHGAAAADGDGGARRRKGRAPERRAGRTRSTA